MCFLTVSLTLFLETTRKMPEGAWVEAEFPNLADIGSTDRVKSVEGMADNLTENRCVQGDHKKLDRMSAEKLEALCQQEREKRLAPERERLIKDCVERQDKSQEHCENFYHDFGDATRVDRWTMRHELYMDLPECVAAREARAKEQ